MDTEHTRLQMSIPDSGTFELHTDGSRFPPIEDTFVSGLGRDVCPEHAGAMLPEEFPASSIADRYDRGMLEFSFHRDGVEPKPNSLSVPDAAETILADLAIHH